MPHWSVLVIASLAAPVPTLAQALTQLPGLQVGARVRVSMPPRSVVSGTLMAHRSDTLFLRRQGSDDTLRVHLAEARRVEVSVGRQRRMGTGALLGLVGGMLVGAAVGAARHEERSTSLDFGPGLAAAWGSAIGGASGTAIGLVLGARRTERWRSVDHRRRTSQLRVVPAGGLALSITR